MGGGWERFPGSDDFLQAAHYGLEQMGRNVDPAEPLPDGTEQCHLEAELGRALEAPGQVRLHPAALAGREAAIHVLVKAANHLRAGRAIGEANHPDRPRPSWDRSDMQAKRRPPGESSPPRGRGSAHTTRRRGPRTW